MSKVLTVPDSTPAFSIIPTFGTAEVQCTPAVGGEGGGSVNSITATGGAPLITVNNVDPTNPVVTTQPSEYLGELARGNGAGGWERATDGVYHATTMQPRSTDIAGIVEMVSGTGHMHLETANPAELLSPDGNDLLLAANGITAAARLQVQGVTRHDGVVVALFAEGGPGTAVTTIGFYGAPPQQQQNVAGTDPETALNALLAVLNANGFVGTVQTVFAHRLLFAEWACISAPAIAATARFPIPYATSTAPSGAAEAAGIVLSPVQGTITDLYVRHGTALTTDSITYTVRVNAVDTAATLVIAATTTTGHLNGLNIPFNAGDIVTVKMVQSGTQAQASLFATISCAYRPAA